MADHGIARDQLRAFIERVERLEEEKTAVGDDLKEVYAEAKASGFDTKVMRQIVRIRRQDPNERAEFEAVLDLYLHSLGMLDRDAPDLHEADPREPIRAARHDGVSFSLKAHRGASSFQS